MEDTLQGVTVDKSNATKVFKHDYTELSSTAIINKAKERFKELEHKGFEWRSFYNGFLDGFACNFLTKRRDIEQLFDELANLNNKTRKEAIEDYIAYYKSINKEL